MFEDPVHTMFARYHDYCVPPIEISNPALNEQLEVPNQEQSDIMESDSEHYTEGTTDTGPGCWIVRVMRKINRAGEQ